MAGVERALIAKSALRKLPVKADDGTPFCPVCRRHGELNPMVGTGPTGYRQCTAWSVPIYADSDRLTFQQLAAGEPCRGCGQDILPQGEPPSWFGKGTMYLSSDERAGYDAAEQAFKQQHPGCHALRWSVQGSPAMHCGRCCPPPPMSPEQARWTLQFLNDAADARALQARFAGTGYGPHELERRLPGRARSQALVLREYQQRRTAVLKQVEEQDGVWLRSSWPEPEVMFRWRLQLGCGDLVEVLSRGADRPPTEIGWSWAGHTLQIGSYGCREHQAEEPPYRRVCRYLTRSTLELTADERLARGPETVGYWTVELECGHQDTQVTPLDWKPQDGHRQSASNDPDEVTRRTARIEKLKDLFTAGEYAHAIRQIEEGHLQPDPMTICQACTYQQPIVAFQRIGWLIPPTPIPKTPTPPAAARPTRTQLEKRVAELEAEIAELKAGPHADHRRSRHRTLPLRPPLVM